MTVSVSVKGLKLGLGWGFVHITQMVILRTVRHITHFDVFRYLQDGPANNGPAE